MWDPSDTGPAKVHVRVRLDVVEKWVRYAAVGQEAFLKEFSGGSMVLGGLANAAPSLWTAEDRADIRHEFGHVLGFLHEQQRPECSKEWRLEKGPNGEPSIFEVYAQLYDWEEAKTRTNLLLAEHYKIQASGQPDKLSIFNYPTFDEVLPATLSGSNGPCYVKKKNLRLSKGDIERARRDYPFNTNNSITDFASANIPTLKAVAGDSAAPLSTNPLLQRIEIAEKALRPLVYVQIAAERQREAGKALLRRFQGIGYLAPGVENIAGKAQPPARPEVRYFSGADAEDARNIAAMVGSELGVASVPTRLVTATQQNRKLPIEVWLSKEQ